MDPTDPLSVQTHALTGLWTPSAPTFDLSSNELLARALEAYPSQIYQGWQPSPPSMEDAANASPLMQLGLAYAYPDLFGYLGPSSFSSQQDGDAGQYGATPSSASDVAVASSAATGNLQNFNDQGVGPDGASGGSSTLSDSSANPIAGQAQVPPQSSTGVQPVSQAANSPTPLLPPQPLQLRALAAAPQLAPVSSDSLDFTPTYLGVPGALAFNRTGLQRNADGSQSLGGVALPAHGTPAEQFLVDGQTPTASIGLSSPSADELSLKPVVQNGKLQMAIYDDTTRQKWVVDSTPGQSTTLYNIKGEPIAFSSVDLTKGGDRPGIKTASADVFTGLKDSEADQNDLSLRPDGDLWSLRNLGYQEKKIEGVLGLGAALKDVAVLGAGKFAAIAAGAGKATEEVPSAAGNAALLDAEPYENLAPKLRGTGIQAHHLNQQAAYGKIIPRGKGLTVGMEGDAFTQPGTPHFNFHSALEEFWAPYRSGSLRGSFPTNAQYGAALKSALARAGASQEQAATWAEQAAKQRIEHGLLESDPVPQIPRRLPQARGR